jgi:hypothetical protein
VATAGDHDWSWRFWLPVAIATVSLASVSVTLLEGQWTTLSEMGLLRPAITLSSCGLGSPPIDSVAQQHWLFRQLRPIGLTRKPGHRWRSTAATV